MGPSEDAMAKKSNLAVKIEPALRRRLQALGETRRRSPHWLMCEAIRVYVEHEEQLERGKTEARERLAQYDATGEYLADEDVDAWLATWGKPRERPAPTRKRRVSTR
jgi:predicted transcriptional regulator